MNEIYQLIGFITNRRDECDEDDDHYIKYSQVLMYLYDALNQIEVAFDN